MKSVSNGRQLCSLLVLLIVSVAVAPFMKCLSTSAQLARLLLSSRSPSGLSADLPGKIPELRFCVQGHLSSGPVLISLLQLILIVLIFIVARRHRRDTQSLFAKAFRSSPLPITISTLDEGRLLNVNDAFVQMLGYTRKDAIGRTAAELNIWAAKEDRLRLFHTLQHSTTVPTFETKFKTSIGEVREISISAERIELDGTAWVLAIAQRELSRIQRDRGRHANSVYSDRRRPCCDVLAAIRQSDGQVGGVGLPGMRERIGYVGGEVRIESNEHGTTIAALIPAGNRAA